MKSLETSPPVFSIIMPVHNAEKTLNSSIASVKAQTIKQFELIVIDDGSTDSSLAILKDVASKDDRIRLMVFENNRGVSAARNAGLEAAKGKYISLIDSDDEWVPEKLEAQLTIFETTKAGLVYCDASIIDDRGKEKPFLYSQHHTPHQGQVLEYLIKENFVLTSSASFCSDLVGKIGLFNEFLHAAEDYDYWLRVASAGVPFGYSPRVLVTYHLTGENTSQKQELMTSSLIRVLRAQKLRNPKYHAAILQRTSVNKNHLSNFYWHRFRTEKAAFPVKLKLILKFVYFLDSPTALLKMIKKYVSRRLKTEPN